MEPYLGNSVDLTAIYLYKYFIRENFTTEKERSQKVLIELVFGKRSSWCCHLEQHLIVISIVQKS